MGSPLGGRSRTRLKHGRDLSLDMLRAHLGITLMIVQGALDFFGIALGVPQRRSELTGEVSDVFKQSLSGNAKILVFEDAVDPPLDFLQQVHWHSGLRWGAGHATHDRDPCAAS